MYAAIWCNCSKRNRIVSPLVRLMSQTGTGFWKGPGFYTPLRPEHWVEKRRAEPTLAAYCAPSDLESLTLRIPSDTQIPQQNFPGIPVAQVCNLRLTLAELQPLHVACTPKGRHSQLPQGCGPSWLSNRRLWVFAVLRIPGSSRWLPNLHHRSGRQMCEEAIRPRRLTLLRPIPRRRLARGLPVVR